MARTRRTRKAKTLNQLDKETEALQAQLEAVKAQRSKLQEDMQKFIGSAAVAVFGTDHFSSEADAERFFNALKGKAEVNDAASNGTDEESGETEADVEEAARAAEAQGTPVGAAVTDQLREKADKVINQGVDKFSEVKDRVDEDVHRVVPSSPFGDFPASA